MRRKHRLKELTIKDNFMFGAVMMDENNCWGLLEKSAGDTDRSGGSQPGRRVSYIIRNTKVSDWMFIQCVVKPLALAMGI